MARSGKSARSRWPRRLRFTREGRVFLLATLGVGAGAVNTANNLLYLVLGLMLSLIVLSGILSEAVLRGARARRRLPRRAFAGTTALVEVTLQNEKRRLPSFSIAVRDRSAEGPMEERVYFPKVHAGESLEAAYRFDPPRRGPLELEGFVVSTRYPFGLFEKSRFVPAPESWLIYPEIGEGEARLGRHRRGLESSSAGAGQGVDVIGLRDHQPTDEARSVHWRRSAALGRMVVRERGRESARRLTILLDNGRPEGADAAWDEAFERLVSEAAGAAERASRAGVAVEVRARDGASPLVLPGAPADPILRFLALVAPAATDAELPDVRGEVAHFAVETMSQGAA